MTKPADLTAYLFDGARPPLAADLLGWMEASPRFTAFMETYRDKIRKKIRTAQSLESLLDVRGELEVACRLLRDRRLALVYEPVMAEKRRGPDFAVTYRVNTAFNVEVARIRADGEPGEGPDLSRKSERILRILLDKLGQMQPGMPNMLAIHAPVVVVQSLDLAALLQEIKTLAEGKAPAFYAISRYTNPADFYKEFLRLSGIVLWGEGASQLWVNKQAKPALEEKALRLVGALLGG